MLKESSKLKELKTIRKGLIKESNDFKTIVPDDIKFERDKVNVT